MGTLLLTLPFIIKGGGLTPKSFGFGFPPVDMLLPIFIALDVLCVAADPTFFGSTAGQAPPPLDPAEIPAPLEGGVAYECVYACDMRKLREMLFAPASPFYSEFMRQMGRDQAVVEPYRKSGNVWERKVTYRAPRTTLVRSNTVYESHSM